MRDKEIAKKWFKALDRHEGSWNGKYYTERNEVELFAESLTNEELKSGFAQMIIAFTRDSSSTVEEICNIVLSEECYRTGKYF